jgi:hypothetical protein
MEPVHGVTYASVTAALRRTYEKGDSVKKQQHMKKSLRLNKEALVLLSPPALKKVVGGLSNNSCFPDICQEWDSSGC